MLLPKSNKESVLIFGASRLQGTIINAVKRLGYTSVAIDPDPCAYMKNDADYFYCIKGNDYNATTKVVIKHNIKGIVTAGTEKPLKMMSNIASKFKFRFPSVKSIDNSIDKYKLKCTLKKKKISCSEGFLICNLYELKEKYENFNYPLVIKPVDSSGSRGVFYCKTPASLLKFYNKSRIYSISGNVIIEEFISGHEISVESITYKNVTEIIQVTDKYLSKKPYFVEMGHSQPSNISKDILIKVRSIVKEAVRAIGLDNCAAHTELKITEDGPKIIELGPRLGGDYITSELVPASTGVNMEEEIIKLSLNKIPDLRHTKNCGSAIMYLDLDEGKVENIDSSWKDTVKFPGIIDAHLKLRKNSRVRIIENSLDRYGYVIASGRTAKDAIKITKQAIKFIKSKITFKDNL